MIFVELGRKIQVSENASPLMDHKRSSFPSPTGTNNTRWDTAGVCMSMAKESIRKETGRFKTLVQFWRCTNSPRYHVGRFRAYRNCPNKRYPVIAVNSTVWSIQFHDGSNQRWSVYTIRTCSDIFNGSALHFFNQRFQITRYSKEEGIGYLDHVLCMCEMMNPSTSRLTWLTCAGYLKWKYER